MEQTPVEPVKVSILSGFLGNNRQSSSCFDYFIFLIQHGHEHVWIRYGHFVFGKGIFLKFDIPSIVNKSA